MAETVCRYLHFLGIVALGGSLIAGSGAGSGCETAGTLPGISDTEPRKG